MARPFLAIAVLAFVSCSMPGSQSPGGTELSDVAKATEALRSLSSKDGALLPVFVDDEQGRVLITLPAPQGPDGELGRYLFLEGLRSGVGHNDIGLDRGQMGGARLLRLRRLGNKVLFEEPNLRFRAPSGDAAARRATDESFASSILWAADVEASDEDGSALLDVTPFLLRDAHGVARGLAATGQGSYRIDAARSLVDTSACLAFPDNLEFEAILTFASERPGQLVRATVPAPDAVSVVQHLSLVRLPDDGYQVRTFDPRAGTFGLAYQDTTAPLTGGVERQLAMRHRLQAIDPQAPRSRVVEPIVYHVDRGAPEAVRDALLEGARWWAEAFDAAGFVDAFRVELMPEGAHPMDVRYNVIQWVHRSTRGWSYGNAISDPRTGEIVKGHVSLGSLRVRQDRLIFEGLLGTAGTGSGGADDPLQLALARVRQLSAHEVGHTLGLAHNFAASQVFNGSVMDYPAPNVHVGTDGELDTSRAYGVGIGPWDRQSVFWLYSQVEAGSAEEAFLGELAGQAQSELPFLSDQDARPPGASHPGANLWDNGADAVEGLERSLAVRRLALDRFGADRIAEGQPLASLEEVFATVYFHHRYQLTAAAKTIGGVEYTHALNDGGEHGAVPVNAVRQRHALETLLATLEPRFLDISDQTLSLMLPRPPGTNRNREQLGSRTAPAFDALGAAATCARMTVSQLLQRERMARVVDQHRRDPRLPALQDVLETLVARTFRDPPGDPRLDALHEVVEQVVIEALIDLAADTRTTAAVRADVEQRLDQLQAELTMRTKPRSAIQRQQIRRFLERPVSPDPGSAAPAAPPPGSPIGAFLGTLADPGACSLEP